MGDKKVKKFKLTASDVESMSFQSCLFSGFHTYLTGNREEVLKHLQSILGEHNIEMPDGLDGYETFRKVMQETSDEELRKDVVRLIVDLFIHNEVSQNLLRLTSSMRERDLLWDLVEHFNEMLEMRLHELRDGAERLDEKHSKSSDLAA